MARCRPGVILYVRDSRLGESYVRVLREAGWSCRTVDSIQDVLGGSAAQVPGVVVLDADGGGTAVVEAMDRLRDLWPDVPVVLLADRVPAEVVLAWMHAGARDVLVKPVEAKQVVEAAERWSVSRGGGAGVAGCGAFPTSTLSGAVHSLIEVLEAKDRYCMGFSREVARLSENLAVRLDLPDRSRQAVCLAALLHDVGRVALRDDVLSKMGPLSAEEIAHIRSHPLVGEQILRHLFADAEFLAAVRHHHEHYDGHGYPDGLTGEAIPLVARIVAVADAYVAMTQERPHRPRRTSEEALAEIRKRVGSQFCPRVVAVLAKVRAGNGAAARAGDVAAEGAPPARRPPLFQRPDAEAASAGTASAADETDRRIAAVLDLKSFPAVVAKVIEDTSGEDVNLQEVANDIKGDPVLAGKLLSLANSSLYGGRVRIESIDRAVLKLGVSRVRQLAMGIGVIDRWGSACDALNRESFWRHSMGVAVLARRLAGARGAGFQESAYSAGFLHDVGQLVLTAGLGDAYLDVLRDACQGLGCLPELERQRLGRDHASVIRLLGDRWRLPAMLVEAAACHHLGWNAIQELDADLLPLVLCVRIADILANSLTPLGTDRPGAVESIPAAFLKFLDVDEPALLDYLAVVPQEVVILGQAYGVLSDTELANTIPPVDPQQPPGYYYSEQLETVDPLPLFLASQGLLVDRATSFSLRGRAAGNYWNCIRVATASFLRMVVAEMDRATVGPDVIRERTLLFLPSVMPAEILAFLREQHIRFLQEPWNVHAMLRAMSDMVRAAPPAADA